MNQTIYTDKSKNAIRFSKFRKLESDCPFSGLGVKFVTDGEENYFANGKKHRVKAGQYIIGNDLTNSVVHINHEQPVQGLCIDISSEIISEVSEYHDLNGSELKEFLLSDQFLVNKYDVATSTVGRVLIEMSQRIRSGTFSNDFQSNELFYALAEHMIIDQRFVFNHLKKLDFKKKHTNEEVFRAIYQAKSRIDLHVSENHSLEEIANEAGISKYHFLRVFKIVFGVSPYQYQKTKRLEMAKSDLLAGREIYPTSIRWGFPDVQSFTKSFKKQFGQTPGSIIKSNF